MVTFLRAFFTAMLGLVGLLAYATAALAADEMILKHDNGKMDSKRSSTGGGHAILFDRPEQDEWYLDRVEVFGARYGNPQPPDEDFTVYVTDPSMERYCAIARPYGTFARGPEQWTRIALPPVRVPARFYVCLVFNPTQ